MKIYLKNDSSVPLFQQIKNCIIENIMQQELRAEEKLPSVRVLAKELKISILTVKKAYDELEKEGFIEIKQGLGTFVAKDIINLTIEEKQKKLESLIEEVIKLSNDINLSYEELQDLIKFMYRG